MPKVIQYLCKSTAKWDLFSPNQPNYLNEVVPKIPAKLIIAFKLTIQVSVDPLSCCGTVLVSIGSFWFGGLCCIILRELFMFSTSVELGFSHFPLSLYVPYLFIFGRAEYFFSKIITETKQEKLIFLSPWDYLGVCLGPIWTCFYS